MNLTFYIFLFLSGIVVGLFSGLLGIGGALLMFPILLYVPQLLGLQKIAVHFVTGITAMQTTFGTGAAAYFHHKEGNVSFSLVLNIGIGIATGAFVGAITSKLLSEETLIWIYIVVLFTAVTLLLLRTKPDEEKETAKQVNVEVYKGVIFGLLVGYPAGAIGLAGSVIIIPLLNTVFDVPIKICISSGTHIAFIASVITFVGKLLTGQIELVSAVVVSISATTGAYIGTQLNKKADPKFLKIVLLVLIVFTLVRLLSDVLTR